MWEDMYSDKVGLSKGGVKVDKYQGWRGGGRCASATAAASLPPPPRHHWPPSGPQPLVRGAPTIITQIL